MNRPDLTDWIAVGLGAIGGILALVASVQGVRLKYEGAVTETGGFVAGPEKIVVAIRKTSKVLLVGSVVVLISVAIQVVQLIGRY